MEYNAQKAKEAQLKYCQEKEVPHFAPLSGVCWSCKRNIYDNYNLKSRFNGEDVIRKSTGISVEKASSELITGCPHCNRSYCD